MARPAKYKNDWPGVTSVVGILEKDWIVYWIKSKGFEFTEELKKSSQQLGHGVHKGIEKFLKGYPFSKACEGLDNQQRVMLSKLTEWCGLEQLKAVLIEDPLHSERYKFAGTPDCVCTFNGGKTLTIVDWKTDSTPKPGQATRSRETKYRYQAAGYSILYKEKYDVEIGKAIFVRVTKDLDAAGNPAPKLTIIRINNVKSARHKFLALRRIYKDVKGK